MRSFISFTHKIRVIKSRRISWANHVALMGRSMHIGFWWENQKKGDN
jgi:hypothetical protein